MKAEFHDHARCEHAWTGQPDGDPRVGDGKGNARSLAPGSGVEKDLRRRYRLCGGRAHLPAEASGVGRTLGPADGIRMTPLALKGSPPG
ncbi:hypothetical protein GCM10009642_48410 [Nocardiopsis metallicus]